MSGWQDNGGIPIGFSTDTYKTYSDYIVVSSLEDALKMFKDK